MKELKDVKLFTTGDFKGGSAVFTGDVLQKIVENNKTNSEKIMPVMKFSHGTKQIILRSLAKQHGFDITDEEMMGEEVFGLGKIEGLYVKDDALYAEKISDIPEPFVQFVNSQSTRRFSPEFYKMENGTRMLRAVALTGVPENKEMEYLTFTEEDYKIEKLEQKNTHKEDIGMADTKNKELVSKLTDEKAKLELELEKYREDNKKLETNLKREKINNKVDRHLASGNITKGQETLVTEIYAEVYGIAVEKFDESKVSKFEEFVNTLKPIDLDTKTLSVKVEDEKKIETHSETEVKETKTDDYSEMDTEITKIMTEQKVGIGEAQKIYFEKGV